MFSKTIYQIQADQLDLLLLDITRMSLRCNI